MIATEDQKFNFVFLFRWAKKLDEKAANKIAVDYTKFDINYKEACEQLREVIKSEI